MIREQFEKSGPKGSDIVSRISRLVINRHLNSVFGGTKLITFHAPLQVPALQGSSRQLKNVLSKLKTAKRPFIMIGSQALLSADKVNNGELTKAIEKLGLPVGLSGMARGLMGSGHRLQVRQKEARRKALRETDLIILVKKNFKFTKFKKKFIFFKKKAGVPCDFRLEYGFKINRNAYHIGLNRDKVDLYKNKSPNYALQVDAGEFLIELANLADSNVSSNWQTWLGDLQKLETEEEGKIFQSANEEKSDKINPIVACKVIQQLADQKEAVFVADGGDFVATASYIVQPRSPLSWLDPGAFGTLGCGLGFAIGAKLARPESEVWILFGDGALGFSMIEFDTCVRHNIPIIAAIG